METAHTLQGRCEQLYGTCDRGALLASSKDIVDKLRTSSIARADELAASLVAEMSELQQLDSASTGGHTPHRCAVVTHLHGSFHCCFCGHRWPADI